MSKKHTIEKMQQWAKKHNGECFSKEYINAHTKLEWKCSKGHIFWKKPNSVQQGSFCPQCGVEKRTQKQKRYNIEDMIKFAQFFDGECLSKKYKNNHTKLKWRCKRGHIWYSTPNSVISANKWCKECSYIDKKNINRNTLQDAQELAHQNEGVLLTKKYDNCMKKMKWQCKKGHIFEMNYNAVQQGSWCSKCAKNKNYSIEEVETIAEKNGWILLSDSYRDAHQKLKWKCLKCEEVWVINLGNIIYNNSSCPNCSHKQRCQSKIIYDIDDLKKHAQSQNGKCLSVQYNGYHQQHKWQCKKTHTWNATWANIHSGKWCPYCKYKSEQKFREVIEDVLDAKFPKKKPSWLVNEAGNRLELDGYNENLKIAFEYQGKQHFSPQSYFRDTKERFAKRQKHDKIKKSLCKKQGVILLCPTYKLDEIEYEDFIRNNLNI